MSSPITLNLQHWFTSKPQTYDNILEKELLHWSKKGCFAPTQRSQLAKLLKQRIADKLAHKQQQVTEQQLQTLARTYCNDIYDLQLLNDRDPALVYKYQAQTINIINKHLRYYGNTSNDYLHKKLLGEVNDQLIFKLAQGRLRNFKGNSLFKTFFYRVTVFTLKDIFRSLRRHQTEPLQDNISVQPQFPSVTPETFKRQIFRLVPSTFHSKFELSIRVIYRLPIDTHVVKKLYPNASSEALTYIEQHFSTNYAQRAKCTIWNQLLQAIILLENKQQGLRSLQEWIKTNRISLIETLFQKKVTLQTAEQKNAFDTYFEWLVHQSFAS